MPGCTDNQQAKKNSADTSANAATDSAMITNVTDPVTAFPKPPVSGPQEDSSRSTDSSSWFIAAAIQQNRDDITLADLAVKNTSDKEIKKIAGNIKSEHMQLLNRLLVLRATHPVVRVNDNNSVAHHNVEILQKLRGKEFDKNWMDAMIEEYQRTIQQYELRLQEKPGARIKNFISNALPALKKLSETLQSQSSILYKT